MTTDRQKQIEDIASDLTAELVDRGLLIAGGFEAFRHYVIHKDAPPEQVEEMRWAFMAGAEHVWSSVLNFISGSDEELTEQDMRRLEMVQKELDEWREKIMARVEPAQGNA